ncbi:MAG: hypothetical protein WB443_14260 [Nitrososphaeraceae archaeon]
MVLPRAVKLIINYMERALKAYINSLAFVKKRSNIRCIFKAAEGKYHVLILPE